MSDIQIIKHCSPTLAGFKTAGMFTCKYDSTSTLFDELRHFNRLLSGKGIAILPIRQKDGNALIYVYRPDMLRESLADPEVSKLLESLGYDPNNMSLCIKRLMEELSTGDFPHEIGVFLGYPLEDVLGFIRNKGQNFKSVGMWKVYGDKKRCEMLFEKYRNCTSSYIRAYDRGNTIERLAVAV